MTVLVFKIPFSPAAKPSPTTQNNRERRRYFDQSVWTHRQNKEMKGGVNIVYLHTS